MGIDYQYADQAVAHPFNLPFPSVCQTIRCKFIAITVVTLAVEEGKRMGLRFESLNDSRHIKDIGYETLL